MQARVFLTTIDDEARARELARSWVESKRAACVQILPGLVSTYRWKDAVQVESEHLLLLKFSCEADQLAARLDAFARDHPYDVPEFLSLPVDACTPAYGAWLHENSDAGEPHADER